MALTLQLHHKETTGHNMVEHHSWTLRDGDTDLGLLMLTSLDYSRFESVPMSGRWVSRMCSYLDTLGRCLLDPHRARAVLNPSLDQFRGETGKLLIVNTITMLGDIDLSRKGLNETMELVRTEYSGKNDFLCAIGWRQQAEELGLSELAFLTAMGPYRGREVMRSLAVGVIPPSPAPSNTPSPKDDALLSHLLRDLGSDL